MNNNIEVITSKIRDIIQDNYKTFSDVFEYYGYSKEFTLTEANVSSSTIKVYKNDVLMTSGYTYDSTAIKIIVTASLTAGDNIRIDYSAYEKYSDTELAGFIRSSLIYISTNRYADFRDRCGKIFPTPSQGEENMIALIASILINKSISEYRTPEVTIKFNDKQSVEEKIESVISKFSSFLGVFDFNRLEQMGDDYEA